MATDFQSFEQSALGAFVESPLSARGESSPFVTSIEGVLYVAGNYTSFNGSGSLDHLISYDSLGDDAWETVEIINSSTTETAMLGSGNEPVGFAILDDETYIAIDAGSSDACVYRRATVSQGVFQHLGLSADRLKGGAKWIGVYDGKITVVGDQTLNTTASGTLGIGAYQYDPDTGTWSELGTFDSDAPDDSIRGALVHGSKLYVFGTWEDFPAGSTNGTERALEASGLLEIWDGATWSTVEGRPRGEYFQASPAPLQNPLSTTITAMCRHGNNFFLAVQFDGQYNIMDAYTDCNGDSFDWDTAETPGLRVVTNPAIINASGALITDGGCFQFPSTEVASTLLKWNGQEGGFTAIGDTSKEQGPLHFSVIDPGTAGLHGGTALVKTAAAGLHSHAEKLYAIDVDYADTTTYPANNDDLFGSVCEIDPDASVGSQFSDLDGGLRKNTNDIGTAQSVTSYGTLLVVGSNDASKAGNPTSTATANNIFAWDPDAGAWDEIETATGTNAVTADVLLVHNAEFPGVGAPPAVSISAPADMSQHETDDSITFTGSALDARDGTISANLTWTSSLDGQIGTGATFNASLTIGAHTITAAVTDSDGNSGQAQISVVVVANDDPVVTITAPADQSEFTNGTEITLSGTAIDPEDGDISANIDWDSRIDGALGTGASINVTLSDDATHEITATVTDSDSNEVSATIDVIMSGRP